MISIISCYSDFYLNKMFFTFFIKSIDSSDRGRLMVTSQDIYFFRVLNLVGIEEANSLNSLSSPINVISQEQIIGLGREASILKKSKHIIVLAMNIATDLKRGLDLDEHWLTEEDVFNSPDDTQNDGLLKFDKLARFVVPHFQQSLDCRIDVNLYFLTHF